MFDDLVIFSSVSAFIEGRLDAFVSERMSAVSSEVAGPLRVALALYVVLYGVAILRGAILEPVVDFTVRSIKLMFIYALTTSSAYGTYVTDPLFHALPNALAQAISGGGASTPGASFDELINYATFVSDKAIKSGSIVDPAPWVVGAVVFVVGAVVSALGFGVVMVAKIGLALLVALGPIFIACALFEATRRWFFGWLSQAVNYLVLFALILTLVQLVLDLVRSQWSSIEGLDPVGASLVFIALCVLAAFFFLQMPNLAAGIAGGASAGVSDFGRAAGWFGEGRSSQPARRDAGSPPVAQASGGAR